MSFLTSRSQATLFDIEVLQGIPYTKSFVALGPSGSLLDITSATLTAKVRKMNPATLLVAASVGTVQASLTESSGINVTTPAEGEFDIVISPTVSNAITPGEYRYDVEGVIGGTTHKLARGKFTVVGSSTGTTGYGILDTADWYVNAASYDNSVSLKDQSGNNMHAVLGTSTNAPTYLSFESSKYFYFTGITGNTVRVLDTASLKLTGDMDIRAKITMDDWSPSGIQYIVAKSSVGTTDGGYTFALFTGGELRLITSNGTTNTTHTSSANLSALANGAVKHVRVTLDYDNGASNRVATFYTSDDGVNWNTLGSPQTSAIATIAVNTRNLTVGTNGTAGSGAMTGKVYSAEVRDGINGTVVASLIPNNFTTPYLAALGGVGETWTVVRSSAGKKLCLVDRPMFLLGTDDYLEVADNPLLDFGASESFTVFIALRSHGTPDSYDRIIAKRLNTATAGWDIEFEDVNRRPLFFVHDGTNSASAYNSLNTFTSGATVVLVGRRDISGSAVRSFFSGIESNANTSSPTANSLANAQPLRIGGAPGGTNYSDFEFLAAAVFRRALTNTEIAYVTEVLQ